VTSDPRPAEHTFRWWWPGGSRTVHVEVDLPSDVDEATRDDLGRLISSAPSIHSGDALADAFSDFGPRHGLEMLPVDILDLGFWLIRFVRSTTPSRPVGRKHRQERPRRPRSTP
jgi:hypothetical protein